MGFSSNEYGPGSVPATLATGVPAHTHVDTDVTNMGATGQPVFESATNATALTALGAPSGTGITAIVALTQAAYNGLGSKDATTLYIING